MGRQISIFADYHKQENSLTNYCGLLMKLLYEDNPKHFEELLATLMKAETDVIVGPTFTQQTKIGKRIPDLAITQKSFSLFFETKTTDWFDDDDDGQLDDLLKDFSENADHKTLFLLSNFDIDNFSERFKNTFAEATRKKVNLQPLTFEDFVGSLEKVCNSEYLKNLLDEFKIYLDKNGHLPKWKYLLDVVNSGKTMNEIIEQNVYMCPDTGGPYDHRRAKYFGPYANKVVDFIYEIRAIVVIDKNLGEATIKWKNDLDAKDDVLKREAKNKIQIWQWRIDENKSVPVQVFLLDKREPTKFIKDSSGGMFASKHYFRDIAINCNNSNELAKKLLNKNWSDFPKNT